MHFARMTAEHAMNLRGLEAIHAGFEITPAMAVDLEEIGGTSAIGDDGEVLAIAGILPQWRGVGLAWAWLGRSWRRHAREITYEVARGLAQSDYHRVEAAVRVEYQRGHDWIKRLGFELETPVARKWGPDGADFSIYVRVRNG
jgi:hypothetical protein